MSIEKRRICLTNILQGGENCNNPSINWTNLTGVIRPCLVDGNCIEVELIEGATEHCITVIIDCDDCDQCPPVERRICFCSTSGNCPECSTCNPDTGICMDDCAPGEKCCNGTCGECCDSDDCDCNQICVKGKCECPPDLPFQGPDGCCVECFSNDHCGPCYECKNGRCVPIDCGPGNVCCPDTEKCGTCLDNSDCPPNECCISCEKGCDCCPGYYRDSTGLCVPIPECFGSEDCGENECCEEGKCVPCPCPAGFVNVNGDCVPSCCPTNNCPEGYGCYNCACIPCSELSCDPTTGKQCSRAAGCKCDENGDCVATDCNPSDICADWEYVPGTPGTTVTPGVPAPSVSGVPSNLGVTTFNGGFSYQDTSFAFNSNQTGNWSVALAPGSTQTLANNTTSVTLKLSDFSPPPMGIFTVYFTGTGQYAGTSAEFTVWRDPLMSFTAQDAWTVEKTSKGKPGSTSGGSSGTWTLCSCSGDWNLISISDNPAVPNTGDITLTLGGIHPTNGCRIVTVVGCGTWNGQGTFECDGDLITIPISPFNIPLDDCCDPAVEDCGGGGGDPCEPPYSTRGITLVKAPTGFPSEFMFTADWRTANLTARQFFYMNPQFDCWSTEGDFSLVSVGGTGTYGAPPLWIMATVKINGSGCVKFGYTCDLFVGNCEILKGDYCQDQLCDPLVPCSGGYSVDLKGPDASGCYTANASLIPSTYVWLFNGVQVGTGTTYCPSSPVGVGTLEVVATHTPTNCTCRASIQINDAPPGCNDPGACNYTPGGSGGVCCPIPILTYRCLGGVNIDFGVNLPTECGTYTYTLVDPINGSRTISQGTVSIESGNYIVEISSTAGFNCQTTLDVPDCYRCIGTDCESPANNQGPFENDPSCAGTCDCLTAFDPEIVFSACTDGRATMTVVSGGNSAAGYEVYIRERDGANVTPGYVPMSLINGNWSYTTGLLCPNTYDVTVRDLADPNNCELSTGADLVCSNPCPDPQEMTLTNISYNCDSNQFSFNLTKNFCADFVNVTILQGDVSKGTRTFTTFTGGLRTLNASVPLQDGAYILRLEDSIGCTRDYQYTVMCGSSNPCYIKDPVNFETRLSTDPGRVDAIEFDVFLEVSQTGGTYDIFLYDLNSYPSAACDEFPIPPNPVYSVVLTPTQANVPQVATMWAPNGSWLEEQCWAIVVVERNNPSCTRRRNYYHFPNDPAICSITMGANWTYNPDTNQVTGSWQSENAGGNLVLEIKASDPGNDCSPLDPLVYSNISVPQSSNGSSFTLDSSFSQDNSDSRCLSVRLYNPSVSGCSDSIEIVVPPCECMFTINSYFVDEDTETLNFDYTIVCPDGGFGVSLTGATVSENARISSNVGAGNLTIPINNYPTGGELVTLTVTSLNDTTCSDSKTFELPQLCECSIVVSNMSHDVISNTVTVTTNINDCDVNTVEFSFFDGNGPVTVQETTTIPAIIGVSQSVWTLDALPQGSTVGVNVTNVDLPSCADSDSITTCEIINGSDIAPIGDPARAKVTLEGGNVSDGDTVTIEGKTYTFQTTLTDVDGNVLIGSDTDDTMINLLNAINVEPGDAGVRFAASTTEHPTVSGERVVTSSVSDRAILELVADDTGVVGNGYTVTVSGSNLSVEGFAGGRPPGFYNPGGNSSYSIRGALVLEHEGTVTYTNNSSTGYYLEVPTATTPVSITGTGSAYGAIEQLVNNNGAVLQTSLWTDPGPNLDGQPMWLAGIPTNSSGTFAHCFNVPTAGQYYAAFSVDNFGQLLINNQLIIKLGPPMNGDVEATRVPFRYTFLVPVTLPAGNNVIEGTFVDRGRAQAIHFAVYDNTYSDIVNGNTLNPLVDTSNGGATFGIVPDISFNTPGGVSCPDGYSPIYETTGNGCVVRCTNCI